MSRERILKQVKDSLQANTIGIAPCSCHYQNPMHATSQDLFDEFMLNHTNNKSIIIQSTQATLAQTLNELFESLGAGVVLASADVEVDVDDLDCEVLVYRQKVEMIKKELFGIGVSLLQARCGVANLGILGLSSSPHSPRLISLLTNTCIYLLNKNHIVQSQFEAINFIKAYEQNRLQQKRLPTNIIFVAGPSRTADIELQTVFGVHGPRLTYTICY